jgi:hypothetical protein
VVLYALGPYMSLEEIARRIGHMRTYVREVDVNVRSNSTTIGALVSDSSKLACRLILKYSRSSFSGNGWDNNHRKPFLGCARCWRRCKRRLLLPGNVDERRKRTETTSEAVSELTALGNVVTPASRDEPPKFYNIILLHDPSG